MATSSASEVRFRPPSSNAALRTGLILALVLALGDIVLGLGQLLAAGTIPDAVTLVILGLGAATLLVLPFAWRGSVGAAWVAGITRVLSALSGMPAFFIAGIPAMMVFLAALGMALAVAVVVLLLMGRRQAAS